ncbi:MAG: hypothetical protein IKN27_13200 [Selenomonadaceae bacterium]|nr:hypothetical protein [Selenomonadaceae bacterium]
MRGIKDEFKHLDFAFSRERDCTAQQIEFIVASYAAAFQIRAECFELAARRYRKGEHRFTTCRHMHISESQYYKLLGKFLSIAKAVHERLAAH